MGTNDAARARISAIVSEIEASKAAMGPLYVAEPSDREAWDIVSRIERKLAAATAKAAAE